MTLSQLLRYLLDAVRIARWLNAARAKGYLVILFFIMMSASLWLTALSHGLFGKRDIFTTDFISFYAAGDLARDGQPEAAYDLVKHNADEQRLTEKGVAYFGFFYPPVYLLPCRMLVLLPYLWAFAAWEGITLLFYLAALKPLIPARYFPIAAVAAPAAFLNSASGQNAFLSAALFSGATWLIDESPLLAGALFGGLCYKPHFGVLIPVALLAGRRWSTLAAAVSSAAILATLSVVMFGAAPWYGYLKMIAVSRQTFENGWVAFYQLASVFAAARLLGFGIVSAYALQTVSCLVAMAIIWTIWSRSADRAMRGASLCVGTALATPVILNYDLLIPGVGIAWICWRAALDGFLPWEKITFFVAYVVSLLSAWSGKMLGLLLAPWVFALVFLLLFRRARLGWHIAATSRSAADFSSPMPS